MLWLQTSLWGFQCRIDWPGFCFPLSHFLRLPNLPVVSAGFRNVYSTLIPFSFSLHFCCHLSSVSLLCAAAFDSLLFIPLGLSAAGSEQPLARRPISCQQARSISWSLSIRDVRLDREEHKHSLVHTSLSCSEMADMVFPPLPPVFCCVIPEATDFPAGATVTGTSDQGRVVGENGENETRTVKMWRRWTLSLRRCGCSQGRRGQAGNGGGGSGARLSAAAPAVPDPNGHRKQFRPGRVRRGHGSGRGEEKEGGRGEEGREGLREECLQG